MDVKAKENKVSKSFKKNEMIGFGAFLAITCSMVITVYEYPMFAQAGWSVILFIVVAGACFFLPIVLAAGEMGTVRKWEKNGVFVWISNVLGKRWGMYAIFFQWLAVADGFLGILYYITSGVGFVFGGIDGFNLLTNASDTGTTYALTLTAIDQGHMSTALWESREHFIAWVNSAASGTIAGVTTNYAGVSHGVTTSQTMLVAGAIFGVAVCLFLLITASQLFGVKWTGVVVKYGFWGGIALPTLIIIIFGSMYIAQGHHIIQTGSYSPGMGSPGTDFTRGGSGEAAMLAFVAVILAFIGPEGSGNLANKLKNVERNYPLAIFTLMFLSISFSALGGTFLAISTEGGISETGGLTIGLINLVLSTTNINAYAVLGFCRFVVFLICFGILAELASWIVGPVNVLGMAAGQKLLPKIFGYRNKWEVPLFSVLVQTIVVIILECIITLGIGSSGGQVFMTGVSAMVIVYLLVYFMMWISYIKFLLVAPKMPRAFRIKARWFSIIVAIVGIMCAGIGWCASWINSSGASLTMQFYLILAFIAAGLIGFAEALFDGYRVYKLRKLLKQYGLRDTKADRAKLYAEHPEAMAEYRSEPLTPPTQAEIEAEEQLRAQEKANAKHLFSKK